MQSLPSSASAADARWRKRLWIALLVPLAFGLMVAWILFYRDTGDTPVIYATLWSPIASDSGIKKPKISVYFEVNDSLTSFFGSSRLRVEGIPVGSTLILSNIPGVHACTPGSDASITVSEIPGEWGRRHSNYENKLFAIKVDARPTGNQPPFGEASVTCATDIHPKHASFTDREIAFNDLSEIWSVSKPVLPLAPRSHELGVQRFGVVSEAPPASVSFRGRGNDLPYPGVDTLRVRVHEFLPDRFEGSRAGDWESHAADSGRLDATWEPAGISQLRDLLLLVAGALFSLTASAALELIKPAR